MLYRRSLWVRHPGPSTDSRQNRGHRGVDGDVHHGVRGAKASLCPLGCERECRCPAPARAVGLLPPLPPAHCTLCTWMSRHRPSLRGDKGSSDAQLCLCTKAHWRWSSPARVPEGVLGGPGGGAWGPTAAAKPMEAASLLAAQRARRRRRQLGTLPVGARHLEGWSLASSAKSNRSRETGVLLPGPWCSATAGPRGSPVTHTKSQLWVRSRLSLARHARKLRLGGGEGRGGEGRAPRRVPPWPTRPPGPALGRAAAGRRESGTPARAVELDRGFRRRSAVCHSTTQATRPSEEKPPPRLRCSTSDSRLIKPCAGVSGDSESHVQTARRCAQGPAAHSPARGRGWSEPGAAGVGPQEGPSPGSDPQSFIPGAQTPSSQARPPQEACSSDLDHGAESLSHPDGHRDERETQVSRGSSGRKSFSGPNEAALASAVSNHTALFNLQSSQMTKCLLCISPRPAQRCRPASQHQSRGTGAPPRAVMPRRLLCGSCHTCGAQAHSGDVLSRAWPGRSATVTRTRA